MSHKTVANEAAVVEDLQLPRYLKRHLMKTAYDKEIQTIYMLRYAPLDFVSDIVLFLKPCRPSKSEVILRANEVMGEIMFVSSGTVNIRDPGREDTLGVSSYSSPMLTQYSSTSPVRSPSRAMDVVLAGRVTHGNHFGDMEFYRKALSLANYEASGKCTLYCLSYDHLRNALIKHKEQSTVFYAMCRKRYKALKEVRETRIIEVCDESGIHKGRAYSMMWLDGVAKLTDSDTITKISDNRTFHLTLSTENGYYYQKKMETEKEINQRWIIHPENKLKRLWDIFIGILIIYSVISVTLSICFEIEPSFGDKMMEWIVDFIFLVDIFVVFNTAFLDDEGVLITANTLIAQNYFSKWFCLDLISCMPIDDLVQYLIEGGSNVPNFSLIKALRGLRMFRLLRFDRIVTLVFKLEQDYGVYPGTFELAKLLFFVVMVSHIVCCFWWAAATSFSSYTWYDDQNLRDAPLLDKYTASLYWTVTTLSTVGYGDIVPVNSSEQLASIFVMMLGGVSFGYVVGSMSSLMSSLDFSSSKVISQVHTVRPQINIFIILF